jgi:hypothetical protein
MGEETPKWIQEHVPDDICCSQLFRIKVTFPNGKSATVNLLEDLDIDFDTLEHHLETIPAQYVFWASVYSELRSLVTTFEIKIGRRRAWLTKHFLYEFKEQGIKLTDKQLQYLIDSDDVDKVRITREVKERNRGLADDERLGPSDLAKSISTEIKSAQVRTLPYLESQLAIQQKNTGKVYHMVEAIRIRSENCRSLAGFKRQEKEQAANLT